MVKLFSFIETHKIKILVLNLFLTLVLGYGITRLQYRSVLEGELPESDFIIKTNNEFKRVFGDKSYVIFAMVNPNGVINAQTLTKLKAFSEDLRGFPGVNKDEILSLATFTQIEESADGIVIKQLLDNIPQNDAGLQTLLGFLKNNPLIWKRLISEDLTATLITAPIDKATSETQVYEAAQKLKAKYQEDDEVISYSFQIIDAAINEGIDTNMTILFPLSILVMAIFLYLCFTSFRAVFLPLLAVVMSVVWTLGAMGWFGFKISTVTSIIPLMLIALGSSYGIHLFDRYTSVAKAELKSAFAVVAKPIFLANITTAIGFFTLIVFKIVSLHEYGIFAALGIVLMLYFTLIFSPALLFLLPKQESKTTGVIFFTKIADYLLALVFKIAKKPRFVLFGSLILIVISFWGLSYLRVGSNPTKFFPKKHPVRLASDLFSQKFGGTGVIEVMFESQNENGILEPEVLAKIWQFQKYSETLNDVGSTNSIIDALRYINKTLNGEYAIPRTRPLASQYLLLYAMNKTVDLTNDIDQPRQRLKVTIWLYADDSQIIEANYKKMKIYIDKNFPSGITAKFGGENMEWIAQNYYIVTGKITNIICSIIGVFIICVVVFRSLRLGLLSVFPMIYASFVIFGLMGFLGIRLDLASCILTSVTIGVGVDFSIHYLSFFLRADLKVMPLDQAISLTNIKEGKPILFNALANILGFFVFLFSTFTPVRDFGWLVILSMVLCCLGTLIFLPVLIPRVIKIKKEDTR
jgi:predicted RND superfamily exporter protein